MNNVKKIKIKERIHSNLGIRDSAIRLFKDIINNAADVSEIILDFEGVEFMSRSFAQAYAYQKKYTYPKHHPQTKITETNKCKIVNDMLDMVEKQTHDHYK